MPEVLTLDYLTYTAIWWNEWVNTSARVYSLIVDNPDNENPTNFAEAWIKYDDLVELFDTIMLEYFACRFIETLLLKNKIGSSVESSDDGFVLHSGWKSCPLRITIVDTIDTSELECKLKRTDDLVEIILIKDYIINTFLGRLCRSLEENELRKKMNEHDCVRKKILTIMLENPSFRDNITILHSDDPKSVSYSIMTRKKK